MPETCPDRTELSDLVLGKLDEPQLTAVASHIESCGDCQTTIGLIAENEDTFVEAIRERALADEMADESQFQVAMARIEAIGREATPNDQLRAEESPSQLREYELLAKLGEGGMGTVYKALHTRLRRVVALKVLNTHRRHDPAVVERFGREIEAVGKLSHPNIVTAHDAGEEDGMHYLVMELVEGVDLHTLVAQHGPLLVADACEIIRQAALGLQHAHEHRLVHRDLKPSNLMLAPMASAGREPQGASRGSWAGKRDASSPAASAVPLTVSDIERQATNDSRLAPSSPNQPAHAGRSPVAQVKILDLGLARLQGEQMQGREEITATGQVMGTLDYMAPEQADDSHRVDTRSDIYALGCTLYKLLTGHAPFSGESYNSIAKKLRGHAENPPPPIREARPAVPEALADLIDRMLAKSPDDRPGTPADLAAALGPFCDGCDLPALVSQFDIPSQHNLNAASQAEIAMMLPTPKPSLPGRGRRVGIFVAVASLLFFAVAAAAIVIAIRRGDGPATTVEVPEGSQVKIGDDGRVEVKVSADQKSRDQSPPIPEPYIGDPHGDPLPSEKAVARLGSIRLRHGGKIRQVAFSSDGKWLASLGEDDAVRIWDPNTGKQHRRLFHRERGWMTDRNSRLRSARSFCFTPDGASIVSLHLEDYGSKNPSILCIWDVDTGERRKSFPCGDRNFHSTVAVSPDGRIAAVGGRDGAVHLWNLGTGELHARFDYPRELKEIAESLQEQVATGIVAFSPDGELIAAVYSEHILLWELATGKVRRSLSAWRVGRIAFSPDGKTLVAVDDQNVRFPRWDVATGRKLETLLGHTHWVSGVAFSPKGDWMVTAGSYTLRFWNADGEQVRVLGEEDSYQGYGPVAVSPDGNTIAVSTGFRILLLDHETLRERLADPWQASTMYRIAFVDTSGGGASTPKPTAPLVVASYLTRRWELEPAAPTHRGSADGLMRVRPPPKSPPLPEGGDPMNWWETRLGRRLEHLADLGPDRELLTVLPQVRQFVTEDKDPVTGQRKSLTWWDLETGTQIHTLTFEGRGVHWPRIAVSPDGERVASSHAPAFVHWPSEKKPEPTVIVVREVRTGNQLRVFSAPKTELLGFSPNSKQLQILSASGELLLWDLAAPQSVAPQAVPAAVGWPTESWAMTPQCHLLAWSDGCDPQTGHGRIRLYDLQKRRELEPLDGHLGPVRSVAFSPDGRWLASGGSGGTGLVWDMAAAVKEQATATETSCEVHSEDNSTEVASTPTEGKVVGVGPADEKVVWLNLGKDDGLRAKDVWWVYDKDADPAQAQRKGVVEITKVSDSHLTEARVLEHKTDNPILPGDRVVLKTRAPAAGDDAADETAPSTEGNFEALEGQVNKLIEQARSVAWESPERAIAALQTQAAAIERAEHIEPAQRLALLGTIESAVKSLTGRLEQKEQWRSKVEKAIAESRELAKSDREAAARRLGSVEVSTEIVEQFMIHIHNSNDDPLVRLVYEYDRLYDQLDPTGQLRRRLGAERSAVQIRCELKHAMAEIHSRAANTDEEELARTFAMARTCFGRYRSMTSEMEDEGVQSEMSREIDDAERQLSDAVRWSFRNPVVLDSYDAADRFASGPLAWDSCGPGFVLASQRRMGSGPLDLWLSGAPVGGGELLGFRRLGSVPNGGELLMLQWVPGIRIAQPAGIDGDTLTLRIWDYDAERAGAKPQSFDVKWQLKPPIRPDRAGSVVIHAHEGLYQWKGGEETVIQSLFLRLIDKEAPHVSQLLFVRSPDGGKTWPDPPRLVADDLRWHGLPLKPVCFHPSYEAKDTAVAKSDHLICMGMNEDDKVVFFRTLDGGDHWTKEFVRLPDPETGKLVPGIPLASPNPGVTLVYAIPTGDATDRTYRLCHAFAGDGARSWADATTIASNLSLPVRQLFSIRASSGGVTAVTCPVPGDRPEEYHVQLLLSIDERHQFWRAIQLDEQLGGRVGLTLPRAPSYGARVFLAAEVENPDRTENRHQLIVQEIAPVALEFARSKEDESRD